MMKKSLSSENEPCCSKDCKKNTDSLNSKIEDLKSKVSESDIYRYSYKLGVDQLEGRLAEYREREVKYIEKIRTLELYRESNLKSIKILKNEVETLKEEKDVVDANKHVPAGTICNRELTVSVTIYQFKPSSTITRLDKIEKCFSRLYWFVCWTIFRPKKATKDLGYLLAVTTLDKIDEGKVREHSGDVLFHLSFTCLSFKIFRGSRIEKDMTLRCIVIGVKYMEAQKEFQAVVGLEGDYLGPV
nr:hypothetical protein [Tanacetum cinerariifolium]